MTIADKTVLVTGANRGLGQALVAESLARNPARVYGGARRPMPHPDPRVTPLMLDITRPDQIQAAVAEVGRLDLLINNAGILARDHLTDPAAIARHLAVNLFGTHAMCQAFLPALSDTRGAIINILSVNALAPIPVMPAYSISKAAAFSLTQSLRVLLATYGVRVHAVLPGPIDTDMLRGVDIPKTSPVTVAHAIFDALDNGEDDIFPDPMSAFIADSWHDGAAKTLERQLARAATAAP